MRLCLALLGGVLLCGVARAEEPVVDPDTEIAQRHFRAGRDLYARGEYERALAEFETTRRRRPSPAIEFNIGRCHDRLEHVDEAIAAYQRYLAASPAASDAEEVRARVLLLERHRGQPRVEPPPPDPPAGRQRSPLQPVAAATARPPLRRRPWFWGVMAGATVVVAGAISIGVVVGTRDNTRVLPGLSY